MAHDDENELSCTVSRDVEMARYRAALRAGIERDDAGMIAHNLLGHASMVEENAHASPLEELRQGSLQRSWELADPTGVECRALWHLLLAWELKDAGRVEEARATLERLRQGPLPYLGGWLKCLAHLLPHISELEPKAFPELVRALVAQRDTAWPLTEIAAAQLQLGEPGAARETAGGIADPSARARALRDIALAQGRAADAAAAQDTFALALAAVRKIVAKEERAMALQKVIVAQAQAGEGLAALEAAHAIDSAQGRGALLREIVAIRAERGEYAAARESAECIADGLTRDEARSSIVAAQARGGEGFIRGSLTLPCSRTCRRRSARAR